MVRRIRSDNAGEFLSKNFHCWLKKKGIIHERTEDYYTEANSRAETHNITLINMDRTMLVDVKDVLNHQKL